jgi:hypothetical protein
MKGDVTPITIRILGILLEMKHVILAPALEMGRVWDYARFKVFVIEKIQVEVLWIVAPRSDVVGPFCLRLQGKVIQKPRRPELEKMGLCLKE